MVAETALVSKVKEIAYNSLLVYIAADKFGIDSLKQLVKERLITWAENNWNDECFPTIVSEIMALAPSYEIELYELLLNVICENAAGLVEKGSMMDVLEEFGNLAVVVLIKLVGRFR